MKVAITGATGFVGTRLVTKLHEQGCQVVILTRSPSKAARLFLPFEEVNIVPYSPSIYSGEGLAGCDAVVNLAGSPIAERWSTEYKQEILTSRVQVTESLGKAIANLEIKPQVLINASAIGYYGTSETATFTETSPPGQDFLAQVCQQWEAAAQKVSDSGVRVVILRTGIVLGDGGALAKMLGPFKLYAGGPIGTGRQWFSWIHREDLVNLIITAMNNPSWRGVYNATAPEPVSMNQFCQTLGEVLNRPSWLPVPSLALELLLGEGAKVVLEGQQVLPKKTQSQGFRYTYPQLKAALKQILD